MSRRSWGDAGVLGGGPRQNPMCLSRPKLKLWGKNSKKGGEMGGPGGLGWGEEIGESGVMGEGPRKNPMCLSSPKAKKFEKCKNLGQKSVPKNGHFKKWSGKVKNA